MESAAYTTIKPGSAGRTLFCAAAYLIIVLALASSLTNNLLGERVVIPLWKLSLQVPKAFTPTGLQPSIPGEMFAFVKLLPSGGTAVIAVRRFPISSNAAPATVCKEIVQGHLANHDRLPEPTAAPVGPFDGVQVISPSRSVLARVARTGEVIGLAVELVVQGSRIDNQLFELFDQFCRSIHIEDT